MKITGVYFLICFAALLFSCKPPAKNNENLSQTITFVNDTTSVEFSDHFSIHYKSNHKLVYIYKDKQHRDTLGAFLLIPFNHPVPSEYKHAKIIRTPVTKIACLSSLYVAYLEKLELLDKLCAVDNSKFIFSDTTRLFMSTNNIAEVGNSNSINFERLATLAPDVVFTYWEQGLSISSKLNELDITPLLVIDHLETTPLGRAEWIKLMAALFDEEKKANTFFDKIKNEYLKLASLKNKIQKKPTVLVGTRLSDAWYVPGGKSYMAQMIYDAGGNYLWKEDNTPGSLALNFESVLAKARQADIWLNVYQWRSLSDVVRDDNRYSYFKAFKEKRIYNNNARINEFGGNDFWESGLLRPDVLLSDLICIFHPEVLQGSRPIYYKKLE